MSDDDKKKKPDKDDEPVSLHPLNLEGALSALLKVKPDPPRKREEKDEDDQEDAEDD